MGNVARDWDILGDPVVGHCLSSHEPQRQHSGPHRKGEVCRIILRTPRPNLRRGFVQSHSQDLGLGQFSLVRRTDLCPSARYHMFGDRLQCVEPLAAIQDLDGGPEDEDGAIVHRVMKPRTGEDQAVLNCDGHADGGSRGKGPQHPAGGGPMHVQLVAVAGVDRRDDVRLAVHDEADVAGQGLVEDRVDCCPIVCPPLGEAPHRDPGARPHL